jgi:hypothetical protein
MTITISKPELEALIRERMESGAFQDVEDVLMPALQPHPAPSRKPKKNFAQFLAVHARVDQPVEAGPRRDAPRGEAARDPRGGSRGGERRRIIEERLP